MSDPWEVEYGKRMIDGDFLKSWSGRTLGLEEAADLLSELEAKNAVLLAQRDELVEALEMMLSMSPHTAGKDQDGAVIAAAEAAIARVRVRRHG